MIQATFSGFSTALSALQANQKRLDITGQNLANMNTPGYTRQQLETSSLNYSKPTSGYGGGPGLSVGFGVSMNKISQIRDPYLDVQYRSQMNKSSYTDSMQSALDSLSRILDESNNQGLRGAFDDILSSLTNIQDSPNVNDPIFESELRSRMQALTNKLNSAAQQIETAQQSEFDKLNGKGTSEQGACEKVNDILRQIGDLNIQIKQNQINGQPGLELMDERNVLLDELASYIPIEISYFKDDDHNGVVIDSSTGQPVKDANGNDRQKMYEYDAKGNVIGKKEWPDDLKVELVYTDKNNKEQRITLVSGTEGGQGKNYGSMDINGDRDDPLDTSIIFNLPVSVSGTPLNVSAADNWLKGGSIQASLDMLKSYDSTQGSDDVRGFDYYMKNLDLLAETFADIMNGINKDGIQGNPPENADPYELLVNKTGDGGKVNASNIGISNEWINGGTHIGKKGESTNDTILNMKEAMTRANSKLGNKSFAEYVNNLSTILANDASANMSSLKTNVTVLNSIHNSRDSIAGISLDEEAANMMNYVSAYNAASRLMTALDEVLNTLINNTGLVGR